MPSRLSTREVASPYGALDADRFTPGAAVSAHELRELERNARRLTGRGEYLLSLPWRSDGDDVEALGGRTFDASITWRRVLGPVDCARKRHLATGSLRLRARITAGADVLVFVETEQVQMRGLRASANHPNVLRCRGTGAWEWYEMDDIRLGRDDYDAISIWSTAEPSEAFDTGLFGTPSSGSADAVTATDIFDASAVWLNTIARRPGLVVIEFLTSAGGRAVPLRSVTFFSTTALSFDVPLTAAQVRACNNPGVTYRLLQVPYARFGAIALRENDRF